VEVAVTVVMVMAMVVAEVELNSWMDSKRSIILLFFLSRPELSSDSLGVNHIRLRCEKIA
jgi:hypothetical protein